PTAILPPPARKASCRWARAGIFIEYQRRELSRMLTHMTLWTSPHSLATEDRGNNGSAFFSRLPLRAKSAMAEILVSHFCDDRARTPATAAGPLHFVPQTRRSRCPTKGKSEKPDSL